MCTCLFFSNYWIISNLHHPFQSDRNFIQIKLTGSIEVFVWRLFSPIEPSIWKLTDCLVACKSSQCLKNQFLLAGHILYVLKANFVEQLESKWIIKHECDKVMIISMFFLSPSVPPSTLYPSLTPAPRDNMNRDITQLSL